MAAPAGVSEGIPHEPAKAGQAQAELAVAQAGGAEPGEAQPAEASAAEPGEAAPAEAVLAEAVLAEAVLAEAVLAEAVLAEAVLAEAVLAEAVPPGAAPAEAVPVPADVVPWPAAPADEEMASGRDRDVASAEAEAGEPGLVAEPERRDISPLAVAGIILGVIALVGVAVGVLAVVTHGFRPKTVITYRPAAEFGLRPGQCVNSGANALSVTVLSCASPHDAEVFATFSLPAGSWPGTAAVQQDAANGCQSRFASYLNPQLANADLTQEFIYPNQAAWQAGERTVVCEVRAVEGQLTGSVRAKS